jgi:hypothetical protein
MTALLSKIPRSLLVLGPAVGAAALAGGAIGQVRDETTRYPYDPACAWGRVANGRGLIVRCLTRAEAEALMARAAAPVAPASAATSVMADGGAAPAGGIVVELLPLAIDEGKLAGASNRLAAAKDRLAECVTKHGGLGGAKSGELKLRFLVRAQRGRAEGVSVSKRTGLSAETARCAADVIDRRLVGEPDVPMTGVTLTMKFQAR